MTIDPIIAGLVRMLVGEGPPEPGAGYLVHVVDDQVVVRLVYLGQASFRSASSSEGEERKQPYLSPAMLEARDGSHAGRH